MPVADRAVFSLDQATFTDKIVLWDIVECGENTDMDSCYALFTRGDY
jgi:hypothetical protein